MALYLSAEMTDDDKLSLKWRDKCKIEIEVLSNVEKRYNVMSNLSCGKE